ncbi:MAG: hypothetical protein ACRC4U_00500, partial [Shewanella sp.]
CQIMSRQYGKSCQDSMANGWTKCTGARSSHPSLFWIKIQLKSECSCGFVAYCYVLLGETLCFRVMFIPLRFLSFGDRSNERFAVICLCASFSSFIFHLSSFIRLASLSMIAVEFVINLAVAAELNP